MTYDEMIDKTIHDAYNQVFEHWDIFEQFGMTVSVLCPIR